MKLTKILNDINDLLDGDDIENYDVILNVGAKADNVSISNDGKILLVEGWEGHKHPALAGRYLK